VSFKFVYYDPVTMQVEAYFESAFPTNDANCDDLGWRKAVIPDAMDVGRDHKILELDDENILAVEVSLNPVQPLVSPEDVATAEKKQRGIAKLKALGLTDDEIAAL